MGVKVPQQQILWKFKHKVCNVPNALGKCSISVSLKVDSDSGKNETKVVLNSHCCLHASYRPHFQFTAAAGYLLTKCGVSTYVIIASHVLLMVTFSISWRLQLSQYFRGHFGAEPTFNTWLASSMSSFHAA